jgi:hypothetical protein
LQGIPLVAASPVCHDSPMHQASAVEVHAYSPSTWQLVADYASAQQQQQLEASQSGAMLGTVTPFQQLMNAFGDCQSSEEDDAAASGLLPPLHHHDDGSAFGMAAYRGGPHVMPSVAYGLVHHQFVDINCTS